MAVVQTSPREVVILGSTGSIGHQTLDVIAQHPDRLTAVALAAHHDVKTLLDQAKSSGARSLVLADDSPQTREAAQPLLRWAAEAGAEVTFGADALIELSLAHPAAIVVNALVGFAGLRASFEVLAAGRPLALANKESLVVGGDLLMPMSRGADGELLLLPIDSEHGAIFQCLVGEKPAEVARLWVTASGGPFRRWSADAIASATADQALSHPTWSMGPKITVDSASLMNKGLEVIEAHHLFAVDFGAIEVVVQPQSVIHSMVEFIDGSVKAHLGVTDMRIPIQYALSYPDRWSAPTPPLDFRQLGALEFEAPDEDRFPCLALARQAGADGGIMPCVLNAADEVAVASFLAGEVAFGAIPACVGAALEAAPFEPVSSIGQLQETDERTRRYARSWIAAHRV